MINNYLLNICENFHEIWLTFRHLKFILKKMTKRAHGILRLVKIYFPTSFIFDAVLLVLQREEMKKQKMEMESDIFRVLFQILFIRLMAKQ